MKRSPFRHKAPKKRSLLSQDGLKKRTRVLAREAERKKERFARQFHSTEFVEWMKSKPCCCGHPFCSMRGSISATSACLYQVPSEVSHIRSRGAGGTWRDTVPMSPACHHEFHQKGRATFCTSRGWPVERLAELAARYAKEWESRPRIADSEGECEILCGDL